MIVKKEYLNEDKLNEIIGEKIFNTDDSDLIMYFECYLSDKKQENYKTLGIDCITGEIFIYSFSDYGFYCDDEVNFDNLTSEKCNEYYLNSPEIIKAKKIVNKLQEADAII